MEVVPDEYGDASYLEQENLGFEERLAAYKAGAFGFVGVRAIATIEIRRADKNTIVEEIQSPGVWGIESDSGDEYFESVYADEREILLDMLAELHVKVSRSLLTDREKQGERA